MIMAVLSVDFRLWRSMVTKKVIYQIPDGYLINHLLRRRVYDEKCYICCELNNVSLRNVMDFCYIITVYSCAGTDECYYCGIIDYIEDELYWLLCHTAQG